METYFLALAIVGCRAGADCACYTDSLHYVQVPYDVLLSYFCRCHDLVLRTPESRHLQLLQHLDVEERGQWAARCTGATTLGVIIGAVMRERGALWLQGHCRDPLSLRARRRVRPLLRTQPLARLDLWFSASVTEPSSAISAAPRRIVSAAPTDVGSCCSRGAFVARFSTRPTTAPRLLEKRAAPLAGGGPRPAFGRSCVQ